MLYDYHYDLGAALICIVLLIIFHLRKSIYTKSYRIFLILITCNLIASVTDAISCFTISYPHSYPLWLNYVVSLGYLFFYNELSVLFFLYIDSKAKIKRIRHAVQIVSTLMTAFFFLTIASSPWSHLVAYFDQDLVYKHGPMFNILYALPFVMFVLEAGIFIAARNKFNKYQLYASISLIVGMAISVVVTIVVPRALIGPLTMSCIIFFVYVAYENPAFFTYQDTQLLNHRAFVNTLYHYKNVNKQVGVIGLAVQDYDYMRHNLGERIMDVIGVQIADFLYHHYKMNAFNIADDQFVILYSDPKEAQLIQQSIREFFVFPFRAEGQSLKLNAAVINIPSLDLKYKVEDLQSMIIYRLQNPNEVFEQETMVENIIVAKQHRDQVLQAIKRAIDQDNFQIYYQPIFDTKTKTFRSAEALIRLIDEDLGFINPEELIRLAEETGSIDRIGEMVFRKVCAFIRDNKLHNLGVSYIEINLSPKQCVQPELVPLFQSIMQIYKVDPSSINLEITETAEVTESKQWLDSVQKLHAIGVEFSIDDYGSGFASADYLIKVPVSIVKIDKMILWQAMEDEKAMIVLKNTIRMLKELGKEIVVEGVEDEKMIQILVENRVDFLQGYYYSRPIPAADYLEFVKERNSGE